MSPDLVLGVLACTDGSVSGTFAFSAAMPSRKALAPLCVGRELPPPPRVPFQRVTLLSLDSSVNAANLTAAPR